SEHRFDIAVAVCALLRRFHIGTDAGETPEITLDVIARLLTRDAKLIGEAESRNTVDDAEIDRLRPAADGRVHARDRHAEHFARGHGVNVEPIGKGFLQRVDIRDMREKAQLDLAVIGGDEAIALLGNEGRANLSSVIRPYRDVLEIGLAR